MSVKTLRLILGDQLNANHSWFKHKNDQVLYVIAELRQETDYVTHHGQKVYAFFMAMKQFAKALNNAGHNVLHLTLDDTAHYVGLADMIDSLCKQYQVDRFEYQQPDEWRLHQQLLTVSQQLSVESECIDSQHFFNNMSSLQKQFKPKTKHRMEAFYRRMRKLTGYLMQEGKPEGGKWNYDVNNRQSFSQEQKTLIPAKYMFSNQDDEVLSRIEQHKLSYIGNLPKQLDWPINRTQAREALKHFCLYQLPHFGTYQDAMTCQKDDNWALYHSTMSFALNTKMISPKEVIETALQYYQDGKNQITLPQIEGFVRQILGWREFVRGIYWQNAEHYAEQNFFNHTRKLPSYFWTGQTKMKCMSHCINQSLDNAYAHHIQRLMVIGNFCLLFGIDPTEVDDWYLSIYIDAIEWVEQPNTRGMSQFADGGLIASKPYMSSGQYINKMSDYCQHCQYKVNKKTGHLACPFNSLYWHFLSRHEHVLQDNHRLAISYRTWQKMDKENKHAMLTQAENYLQHIERL